MNHYDIEKIYNDLENYLIRNIKKNLTDDMKSFHLKEEKGYGFDWEAWQSTKLRELKRYRKQNKEIVNKRLANIDSQIAEVLQRENRQGKLDAFKNYKEALVHGYKSSVAVKDSFFRLNDRKVNTLIGSVKNDFKTANKAVLRKSNDAYRQVIFEASMYNQTGVMTEQQAIRKAIRDFEQRGINCIEYANGSKHKISDYSKMAIRTASTRAYLHGEGQFRQKIGSTLVLMSKHNTACKLCQPWEGKVLIDDIYSGGTKKDGKYPLMSEAMKQGLYHPNCRHGHGTYYPELGKKTSNNIIGKVEKTPNTEPNIANEDVVSVKKENKLRNKIREIENSIVKEKVEHAYIISKSGIINHVIGNKGSITKGITNYKLDNAIVLHNHPSDVTNYSFSDDDVSFFLKHNLKELRGIDDKYKYYLKQKDNTIRDLTKFTEEYQNVYNEILELSAANKIDIDNDGFHLINKILSEKYNFIYKRYLRRKK